MAISLESSPFLDITKCWFVVGYRRFETTYRSTFKSEAIQKKSMLLLTSKNIEDPNYTAVICCSRPNGELW